MQKTGTQPNRESKDVADPTASFQMALGKLARAYGCAADVKCDSWQFALEIERLISLDVTISTLRWLVAKGYAEHAFEVTRASDTLRKFRPGRNLAFTERTRFVITDAGLSLVKNGLANASPCHLLAIDVAARNEDGCPHWDREGRILRVDRQIVKQYRVPSPNQEAVLSAFQEEGWPRFIHDPLAPVANQDQKQRLRDTIRSLNANQKSRLIHFWGDGTGEHVCWKLTGAEESPPM